MKRGRAPAGRLGRPGLDRGGCGLAGLGWGGSSPTRLGLRRNGLAGLGLRRNGLAGLGLRRGGLAGLGLVAALAGCAPLSDRVILLPGRDGAATGAVTVEPAAASAGSAAPGGLLLAEAYAQADVAAGRVQRSQTSAEAVQRDYGALLAMQAPAPRRFVLGFESGTDRLLPEAEAVLAELLAALAAVPGADLVVTGHTDRVGSLEANDRLSLTRAEAVRARLVAAGAAAGRITVAGRGEREPAVATADEVAEPRNRRVEIRLR